MDYIQYMMTIEKWHKSDKANFDKCCCCGGSGFEAKMCCDGTECGCGGAPVDFVPCQHGCKPAIELGSLDRERRMVDRYAHDIGPCSGDEAALRDEIDARYDQQRELDHEEEEIEQWMQQP